MIQTIAFADLNTLSEFRQITCDKQTTIIKKNSTNITTSENTICF